MLSVIFAASTRVISHHLSLPSVIYGRMTRDNGSPTEQQPLEVQLEEDQGRSDVLRRASYRTPFLLLLPLALLLFYLRDKVKSFENKAAAFAAEARAVPVPPVMW